MFDVCLKCGLVKEIDKKNSAICYVCPFRFPVLKPTCETLDKYDFSECLSACCKEENITLEQVKAVIKEKFDSSVWSAIQNLKPLDFMWYLDSRYNIKFTPKTEYYLCGKN